jgi:NAD(P)H-quinone oxidoreductase subunit 4L
MMMMSTDTFTATAMAEAMPFFMVAATLFITGFAGLIVSRHLIRMLMCLELMLNAVNLLLVSINNVVALGDVSGHVFAIFILTISAAEAAVGLALVMAMYKQHRNVDSDTLTTLKG